MVGFILSASVSNCQTLPGNWKFARMEFTPNVYFDLDSLTQSYNQFFNYQKQQNWEGLLSKPDSVQIQQVFERNVNDMRRMYIRFALPNRYTTNKYETGGIISSEPEKGVYKMDTLKKLLTLIPDGQKNLQAI